MTLLKIGRRPALVGDGAGDTTDPVAASAGELQLVEPVASGNREGLDPLAAGALPAAGHEPQDRPPGRVITVYSPKGGVGTTFLATSIAHALWAGGQRRVCVLDLDLEFGDVAITCGLAPARTIADAAGHTSLTDDLLDSLITTATAGPDAILAPIDPAASETVSAELVAALLTALRARYDHVVVDTPSALTEHVLEAFDAAEHHVLVTTPELPALKNLRLFIDTLDLLGTDPARRVVLLNRTGERAGLGPAEVQTAVRVRVGAQIPTHPDVPAAIDAGCPLFAGSSRRHPVATALLSFADALAGDTAAASARSPRFGLTSRKRSA